MIVESTSDVACNSVNSPAELAMEREDKVEGCESDREGDQEFGSQLFRRIAGSAFWMARVVTKGERAPGVVALRRTEAAGVHLLFDPVDKADGVEMYRALGLIPNARERVAFGDGGGGLRPLIAISRAEKPGKRNVHAHEYAIADLNSA
jgi:hypothetical protein